MMIVVVICGGVIVTISGDIGGDDDISGVCCGVDGCDW